MCLISLSGLPGLTKSIYPGWFPIESSSYKSIRDKRYSNTDMIGLLICA